MNNKIIYFTNRLKEKLWFRPFIFCIFSIIAALLAQFADNTFLKELVPKISDDSLVGLLNTISASMLVIAIFAVASMVSAFSAASSNATPRSFKLVVTDDVSQNALSIFIGAFIFSIVATVALKNGFYGEAGIFILFVLTILLFGVVIITFLRWVDRISRLGRLSNTIQQVEKAALNSLSKNISNPLMGGTPQESSILYNGEACYSNSTGYVHTINIEILQKLAEKEQMHIDLSCVPGSFISFNTPVAFSNTTSGYIKEQIAEAIVIANERSFDDDPRFGIITLSEIASRALSPGINDPGTAIHIIGSMNRLFCAYNKMPSDGPIIKYDRVSVPALKISDLFTDAFRPIARDGAGNVEVMTRLQKCLAIIAAIDHPEFKKEARHQSIQAFKRSEIAMGFQPDIEELRKITLFLSDS
ncbi:DUF2254 domain-containing protein [Arenibacter sp. BSSL-BM3]|uniref:DUF2254 domain-containing protein n=1 Tax=Arenibacter arenosicollis TaxID=2762274 RepID=A0ABR7QRM8_9FLAO|nr:DUF2254 domain-containing protein [Arenibacter arenosicollis]MBC8769843.1 DUF2254 domain-containing protein [Arenibacter arenosicollis]